MNFEDDLRAALRREPAPPDFAARVAARVLPSRSAPRAGKGAIIRRRPLALALAAGIVLAALVPTAVSEYHRREEARALEARRQLMIALAITRTELRQAQRRVNHPLRHTL